jgi:hypothetical protein
MKHKIIKEICPAPNPNLPAPNPNLPAPNPNSHTTHGESAVESLQCLMCYKIFTRKGSLLKNIFKNAKEKRINS